MSDRETNPCSANGRRFAERGARERAARVAEARQNDCGTREVVVGGVAAHRDENRQTGAHCGVDADPAVLDDEALGRVEAEVGQHLEVDVRSRLLVGDDVAGEDTDLAVRVLADRMTQHGPYGRLRRGRGDRHGPAGGQRLGDEAVDAGPAGQEARLDALGEQLGLAGVEALDEQRMVLRVLAEPAFAMTSGVNTLAIRSLPPPISQLLRVRRVVPADRQAELGERGVEGRQVPVPLGVGEDPVAVEDQRRHAQALPALPKTLMYEIVISRRAFDTGANRLGGSHFPAASAVLR